VLLDSQSQFSDAQAITATAASTDIIDLRQANRQLGVGEPLWLYVLVKTTFTAGGAATLTVTLETDDNEGFASPTIVLTTTAIAVGTLVQGYEIFKIGLPANIVERYLRLNYTVATGPFTAGAVSAYINLDVPAWVAHEDGIDFGGV
jgi:hypothetical protein